MLQTSHNVLLLARFYHVVCLCWFCAEVGERAINASAQPASGLLGLSVTIPIATGMRNKSVLSLIDTDIVERNEKELNNF